MQNRPIIGLSADLKMIDPHYFHAVGDKYVRAVTEAAGGLPLLLPAVTTAIDTDEFLDALDGVVLTGSYANVHPSHYGGGEPLDAKQLDPARDAANLRMIPAILERGMPLFGICRGFQEMNVALGGTLHQRVHETGEFNNHLEDASQSLDEQYATAHVVHLTPDGLLHKLADVSEQQVNSLHGQGIDQLAPGVTIEALADDGLVEAFSVNAARSFALAVQWHPEWKPHEHPFYAAIWNEFASACRRYASQRRTRSDVA